MKTPKARSKPAAKKNAKPEVETAPEMVEHVRAFQKRLDAWLSCLELQPKALLGKAAITRKGADAAVLHSHDWYRVQAASRAIAKAMHQDPR